MGLLHDCEHGDRCDCMILARAVGAASHAVDFAYCRTVLQKHWHVRCNHGMGAAPARQTPELPPRDPGDPVQAVLVANA